MGRVTNILDLLALIIQIMATIIMFFNSPSNKPEGSFIYSGNPDFTTPKRKNRWLKNGFLILCLGFILQLISLIIKQ